MGQCHPPLNSVDPLLHEACSIITSRWISLGRFAIHVSQGNDLRLRSSNYRLVLYLVLTAVDRARDLLGNSAEVAVRLELHVALVVGLVVDHLHVPAVVDPELADNDVVDHGLDLPPGVVVAGAELKVGNTCTGQAIIIKLY